MKCHVSWRHLVWRSDSLHRGTFFVHPFFSRSSSLPPPPSLNWMICCYNPFQDLNFLKMIMSSFSELSCVSVFNGIYEYASSCRPLSCLICSVYVVSNFALFSAVPPVCSASDISKFVSYVSGAFAKLRKATIIFIVFVRLSVWP